MSGLEIRPVIEATGALRRASSDCCGAKLDANAGPEAGEFICRECKRPCGRVLGPPEAVSFHG